MHLIRVNRGDKTVRIVAENIVSIEPGEGKTYIFTNAPALNGGAYVITADETPEQIVEMILADD